MTLLDIKQLACAFAEKPVLQALNLTVQSGQVVSILGSNGAGKSTLLKCILGLQDKQAQITGDIMISGLSMLHQANDARKHIAYVPEQPAVYGHLSAIENMRYFLSLSNVKATNSEIENNLIQVGLKSTTWQQACEEYSKGMKQKVMLALGLAKQAKLLLMDEPNSGLDPQATEELNQLIISCKNNGMGVLVVTHDVLSALAFSDQLQMLTQGHLQTVTLDKSNLSLEHLKQLYLGLA